MTDVWGADQMDSLGAFVLDGNDPAESFFFRSE